jgi:hypothetical protein
VRPDGTAVRWRFAFLGPGEPGAALPFLIDDETPRERRVPTATVTETVGGLEKVLVCVEDVDPVVDRFERALGATVEDTVRDATLDASVHLLDGVAGALLVPESGPLLDRLERYGDCVCGFLFEPGTDVPAARVGTSDWSGTAVEWVGPRGTPPGRFGLLP